MESDFEFALRLQNEENAADTSAQITTAAGSSAIKADEIFARKLQSELSGASNLGQLESGEVDADELLARTLQAEFDAVQDEPAYSDIPAFNVDSDDEEVDSDSSRWKYYNNEESRYLEDNEMDMEEDEELQFSAPTLKRKHAGILDSAKSKRHKAESTSAPKQTPTIQRGLSLLDSSPSPLVNFFSRYRSPPPCPKCNARLLPDSTALDVTWPLSDILFPLTVSSVSAEELENCIRSAIHLRCSCSVPGVCLGCFQVLTPEDVEDGPINHCGAARLLCVFGVLDFLAYLNTEENPVIPEAPKGTTGRGGNRRRRGNSSQPKGVGYGTGHNWDSRNHTGRETLQAAENLKRVKIDADASKCLDALCAFLPNSSRPAIADLLPHECLPELLTKSIFIQLVTAYLRNDSLLDITARFSFYSRVLKVLDALTCHEVLLPILSDSFPDPAHSAPSGAQVSPSSSSVDPPPSKSSRKSRAAQSKSQEIETDGGSSNIRPPSAVVERTVPLKTLLGSLVRQADIFIKAASASVGEDAQTVEALSLALDLRTMSEGLTQKIQEFHELRGVAEDAHGDHDSSRKATVEGVSVEEEYIRLLKPLAFDQCTILSGDEVTASSHQPAYGAKTAQLFTNSAPGKRTLHIAKEMATLSTSLPISKSSSIFVRIDEDRVDRMRALISGPDGTPYSFGLWLFDLTFPADYPNVPPHVKNLTTGAGAVRFNPNLYNDGKVCLSLLGTWSGAPEEMWMPGRSTILQVFMSISSMILVELPYFNEPGYGAPVASNQSSKQYNYNIRRQTIRWAVIDQLRNPPKGFEAVVKNHFRILKQEILTTATKWAEEDREILPTNQPLFNGIAVGFPLLPAQPFRGRACKRGGLGRGSAGYGSGTSIGAVAGGVLDASSEEKGKGAVPAAKYNAGWDTLLKDLQTELDNL
ncbi:Baculoviral IAP repeat-containing protein 6 [Gonapodya sp. JEL0774]|nr:Baculoviral IAP repeat-containing protein 6 [Gonapodya sp. JEL0774]